jgi:hypothetical protein
MYAAETGTPLGLVSVVPGAKEGVGVTVAATGVLVGSPASTVEVTWTTTGVSVVSPGGGVGTGGVSLGVAAKMAV